MRPTQVVHQPVAELMYLLGLAVHHPFGLMIDGKENAFHAVIGPLALILGLHAMLVGRRRPSTDRPMEVR